jgi:NAD(P)H-hydrate epimerase
MQRVAADRPWPLFDAAAVRAIETGAAATLPPHALMQRAGLAVARLALTIAPHAKTIWIACGPGNNGGDGFVIARHLDNAGVKVRVLLFAEAAELSGDAAVNHAICVKAGIAVVHCLGDDRYQTDFAEAEWVVDALLGSGLQGAVRPPFDRVIAAINAAPARRFAVDLPSGMDADTGVPLGACVRAHHTATVVAPKAGFASPAAAAYLGRVHVVGMGAPRRLLAEFGA